MNIKQLMADYIELVNDLRLEYPQMPQRDACLIAGQMYVAHKIAMDLEMLTDYLTDRWADDQARLERQQRQDNYEE